MKLLFFLYILAISCLTAGAAGNNNTGDSNQGNDNIGNNNQGDGNLGNNNTGNFNQGDYNQGSLDLGNNNKGSDQHGNGGYRAASSLADLQEKAAQGDPAAQLELGVKYLYGDGVEENPGTAVKWSWKAAKYADKNPFWYLKSAAFVTIGMAYQNMGGGENIQEAIKWYFKSAMLNDHRGMAELSRIYSNGEGVSQDVVTGLAWMYVAADSGVPGTVNNDGVKLAISDLQNKAGTDGVVLARKKAREWSAKIKDAEKGQGSSDSK